MLSQVPQDQAIMSPSADHMFSTILSGRKLTSDYKSVVNDEVSGKIIRACIEEKPVSFFVNNRDDIIQQFHLSGAFYEESELKIMSAYFRQGDVFVDIGANVGNHTVFAGCFLSPKEMIVIEPNPEALPVLKANITLNGLDKLVDLSYLGIGLSRVSGQANVIVPERNLGGARLQVTHSANSIPLVAGDDLLYKRKVDFLKIDVEGMEIDVLCGLRMTIREQRPKILIEVDNYNHRKFFEWLVDNRYEVVGSNFGHIGLFPSVIETEGYENFLIVPSDMP